MKILYLAPEIAFPGHHGGSSHVQGAVESFGRLGNDVFAFGRLGNKLKFYERKGKLKVLRLPVFGNGLMRNFLYVLYSKIFTFFMILSGKADLIYERGRIFGGIGVFIGKIFGKKTVYEMIEPYLSILKSDGRIKNDFILSIIKKWHFLVIRKADITTITHESFLNDVKGGKHLYVNVGVDVKKFNQNVYCDDIRKKFELNDGKTLIYLGSFREWHACENMIKAMKHLTRDNKEIKLLMVGDGKIYGKCRKLINSLGLNRNVILTGNVDFEDVPKYVNAADICLALFDRNYNIFKKFSYFYSPIKINEYKACGKVILASGIGNLKNLVKDKINGILVDESDVTDIIKKIKLIIGNRRLIKIIGANNVKEIKNNYTWDIVNRNILRELYENTPMAKQEK